MIVIDTSALMAILRGEPEAARCITAMATESPLAISAGTLAEATDARLIGEAYDQRGKGIHPAGLNFGDCFAYALAKVRGGTLLYVGGDFAKTDAVAA